jgi:hypothetical protein
MVHSVELGVDRVVVVGTARFQPPHKYSRTVFD